MANVAQWLTTNMTLTTSKHLCEMIRQITDVLCLRGVGEQLLLNSGLVCPMLSVYVLQNPVVQETWRMERARLSLLLIITARYKARYCDRMSSVCLSVCPSVTLVNCHHIGWNSSKIISPL